MDINCACACAHQTDGKCSLRQAPEIFAPDAGKAGRAGCLYFAETVKKHRS